MTHDITRYTKGVAFAPTVYAGDMDRLADGGYTGKVTVENA